MPRRTRPQVAVTEDWQQLILLIDWPEQLAYELIRPVVLFGRSSGERAKETGRAARTLRRKALRFDQIGMASLFAEEQGPASEDRRSLPPPLRQLIVDLQAEYPAFRLKEIARICFIASGRRPSHHTIQRILATGPAPKQAWRRYPRYHDILDPADRRHAVVQLHADGWTVTCIAGYLQTSRQTVHTALRRWIEEGLRGLDDKSSAPRQPAHQVTLRDMNTVRKLQENPELGEFRVHAALLQMGIKLSPRTCGRILALNRALYGLDKPAKAVHEPRPMPFAASRRHQYWTVDVRYLDMHELGGGMIYVITILENFSRAILASALSRSKDLTAYLMVLYAAIRQHGSPEALVSDSDAVFKAKEALRIYQALEIRKEVIEKRQPWQSYIETHFNVQRRMADWQYSRAETWTDLVACHDQFVADYNYQVHWAHRDRQDGRHSPAEVLGWVQGVQRDPAELHRIFYATRFGRTLDKLGYVRFRHWRLYGELGLARKRAAIWLYKETLTVEFTDQPLAQYAVEYEPDWRRLRAITDLRLFETQFRSRQQTLWQLGEDEWVKVVRVPMAFPRRRRHNPIKQLSLLRN